MKLYILVVILMTLFLYACTGGGQQTTDLSKPFVGGSTALRLTFVENAPPAQVSDIDSQTPPNKFPFDVSVQVENLGEHTIINTENNPRMWVELSGLDATDFGLQASPGEDTASLKKDFDEHFQGVRRDPQGNKIEGALTHFSWEFEGYQQRLNGNLLDIPVRADLCYQYEQRVSGRYCLSTNTQDRDEGVCEPNGNKEVYTSAGPLTITSLEQSASGRTSTIVSFDIKHNGNGIISRAGAWLGGSNPATNEYDERGISKTAACSEEFIDQNMVYVIVDPENKIPGLANDQEKLSIRCSGFIGKFSTPEGGEIVDVISKAGKAGYVKLDERGEGTISCTIRNMDADAQREIDIVMIYDYFQTETTTMDVIHLLD